MELNLPRKYLSLDRLTTNAAGTVFDSKRTFISVDVYTFSDTKRPDLVEAL